MKYGITIVVLVFFSGAVTGQTKPGGSITGQIKDIQNEPFAGATVQLLQASDSVILQTAAAAQNGKFRFIGLNRGQYLVAVSATGHRKYISSPLSLENGPLLLPPIILLSAKGAKELKAVEVTARKPLVEQEIDRTIINVSAMIGAATGNTMDVLERTPGITVDANGEISLNGASGINVLIDGRPTYLNGRDLAAYLRSLPGSMLDKIELITNPPAKYDAAGGALINIRLNRKQTQGYSGSVSLAYSQGQLPRTYNSLNLNYLNKKLNVFGNLGLNRHTDAGEEISYRSFRDAQKSGSVNLINNYTILSKEINGRLGLDYTLNSKTVLGFIASINQRKREDEANYTTTSIGEAAVIDSTGKGGNFDEHRWKQTTLNANFQHKFNNAGKELTADINYINYNNKTSQLLHNSVTIPDGETENKNFFYWLPLSVNIFTAKADYTHPLKQKASLSGGWKTSAVENDNQSDYFIKEGTSMTPDLGRSNHFIYRENIHAAYINGRKDWKRMALQLGLRYEYTQTNGRQLGNAIVDDTSFTRNYSGLFPSFHFMIKPDSLMRHTFTLSFVRRINRPGYQQLNPFLFFRDQYSYSSGNPGLLPSYGNRFEFIYRFKQLFFVTLQYDHSTDGVYNTSRMEGNTMISRAENIATRQFIALMFNLNTSITKWWTINFHAGAGKVYNSGEVYGEKLQLNRSVWRANLMHQFRFSKGWSGELFGAYNSHMANGPRIISPRYFANAAAQKKILKGKGSLKISFDDIFYTTRFNEEFKGIGNATSIRNGIQDTRRIGIAFNYNFGKETFSRKRKYNDNTADDVKERVQ